MITYQNLAWLLVLTLCGAFQTSLWPNFFSLPSPQLWLICVFFLCRTKASQELFFLIPASSLILSQFTSYPVGGVFLALALAAGVFVAVRDHSYVTSRAQVFLAILLFSLGWESLLSLIDLFIYGSLLVSGLFYKILQAFITSLVGIYLLPWLEQVTKSQQIEMRYE